jgi:Nif-specific regulatory protein
MMSAYEIEREPEFNSSEQLSFLLTLQEIHRILELTTGFENAVLRVLNLLAERHQLQNSQLSMLDERTQEIRVLAAVGVSGRARSMGRYQLGEGITGQVVKSGKPAGCAGTVASESNGDCR